MNFHHKSTLSRAFSAMPCLANRSQPLKYLSVASTELKNAPIAKDLSKARRVAFHTRRIKVNHRPCGSSDQFGQRLKLGQCQTAALTQMPKSSAEAIFYLSQNVCRLGAEHFVEHRVKNILLLLVVLAK